MEFLKNKVVAVALDRRYPRIVYFESAGGTRIAAEPLAVEPRLYIYRKSDRATLTSDSPEVRTRYDLQINGDLATYRGSVEVDGEEAADFDLTVELDNVDAAITLCNVREHGQYRFLAIRMQHLISADSLQKDSLTITCMLQGRLMDPSKCAPGMYDYSWHGTMARQCGATYRPKFMVAIDLQGYENLLIHDVWHYSRIGGGRACAALGAELMYRQRQIEGTGDMVIQPKPEHRPRIAPLDEPILCGKSRQVRLRFLTTPKGKVFSWQDAARYFQSLVPKEWKPNKLYDKALVNKINISGYLEPRMTFDQVGDIVRKFYNLTDGMKQITYMPFFQYKGGDSGHPEMTPIYEPVGDKKMLLRVMKDVEKYNCVLSFHDNLDQADLMAPWFDPSIISRNSEGEFFSGGHWCGVQLVQISLPEALPKIKKLIAKVVREYGIHTTYHLDTYSGECYRFDANSEHPHSSTEIVEARFEVSRELEKHGINLTSECLMHPYVPYIGHSWALFDWGKLWEGEQQVPFASYVYHGSTSWNSGSAADEKSTLEALIKGGGAGIEPVNNTPDWAMMLDSLYLIQPVYGALRDRKWSDFKEDGPVRRAEYGSQSYVEVNDEKLTYKVVVDGKLLAENFATVTPSPTRKGAYIAYSRTDRELNWPAPAGFRNGPVKAVVLSESGEGVRLEGVVKGGRLKIKLKAHVPVRVWQ